VLGWSLTEARINTLRGALDEHSADALWISSLPDIRWVCGFTGSNGLLIVRRESLHLITDGRYTTQAAREVKQARVHVRGANLVETVKSDRILESCRRAVFQSDHLSVAEYVRLQESIPGIEWEGHEGLLVQAVASKDEQEIDAIRAAQRITEAVFEYLLDWIRPGMMEQEIAAEVIYQHLRRGAERMSFEPIIASGPNSALPHARPTRRTLSTGDVLLLDFGCVKDGYASDMTRTVAVGKPDDEARMVYDVVLEAQLKAIEGAHAGMASKDLDALARDVISEKGYGEAFTHGLGHGIGLQTHEWPRVASTAEYTLPPKAVVSIEPGIYLPDRFGVRIEDLIVLREDGSDVLTLASKEWTEI